VPDAGKHPWDEAKSSASPSIQDDLGPNPSLPVTEWPADATIPYCEALP
jgi:hypothetical protein